MELIDAQLHVWAPHSAARPWVDVAGSASRTLDSIEYPEVLRRMDAVGVFGGILVTPGLYGWDNTYALEAATRHADRFRVVVRLNPHDDDALQTLETLAAHPSTVGFRHMLRTAEDAEFVRSGKIGALLEIAESTGMVLSVLGPDFLSSFGELARQSPGLPIVVDHFGVAAPPPRGQDLDHFRDFDTVLALAEHPNIVMKVTGGPALSELDYPFPDIHPRIRQIVDAFGEDRVIWGTDWTRVPNADYGEGVRYILDEGILSTQEKEKIMGLNARRIFGWPADGHQ